MIRGLACASAVLFLAPSIWAQQGGTRLASVDVSAHPKVMAVIDTPAREGNKELKPKASELRLLENGKVTTEAERVVPFRDTDLGMALIVAVDASGSMKGKPMEAIREGLSKLVSHKRDRDKVAVMTFADDIRWEVRWESSADQIQTAFRELQARGTKTRLYDGIVAALKELEEEAARVSEFPARRCILVLSDGHDEGSVATLAETERKLRADGVRLDSVGLSVGSAAWFRILRQLSATGFGEFEAASTTDDLSKLLERGIERLLDTSVAEFRTEERADGRTHRLGVEWQKQSWRAEATIVIPAGGLLSPLRGVPVAVWGGGAGLAGLLALYFVIRKKPAAADAAVKPSPTPSAAPPPRAVTRTPTKVDASLSAAPRPATQVETTTAAQPHFAAAQVETSIPFDSPSTFKTVATPEPAPTPARRETRLAPAVPTAAHASIFLRVESGPTAGRRFEITEKEFWIGSSPNNHVCLDADAGVSGNHACIRREEQFLRIYDNGSLNNTWVNGLAVGQESVLLAAGDRIQMGQTGFVLEVNP